MSNDSDVMRAVLSGAVPLPEHFEEYYRVFHAEHEAATETMLAEFVDDRMRGTYDRLADTIALDGDARILDIGCGDGALLERVVARSPGVRASGIDLSEIEIARAKERLPATNVERLVACSAEALPFAGGNFDAVFSHMVLMIVPEAARVVREVRRVLKAGSAFVSLVPRMGDPDDAVAQVLRSIPLWVRELHPRFTPVNPGDSRVWRDDALVELFAANGFASVEFDDFTVSRTADSKVLRTLIEQRYYVGSLPPQTRRHVHARVDEWAGNRTFTYQEAMRIIIAR